MKTYILRAPKAVKQQNRPRPPLPLPPPSDPALTATVDAICGPTTPTLPPALGPRVLAIGLDVHNDTIAVSLAPADAREVRRYGIIGGQHDDVLKLLKKLRATHPGTGLKFCYEAGPRGYPSDGGSPHSRTLPLGGHAYQNAGRFRTRTGLGRAAARPDRITCQSAASGFGPGRGFRDLYSSGLRIKTGT